jgi:outer membrane immunogenic protein
MKNQKLLVAAAASAAVFCGAASAADFPVYRKAPAAPAAYDWSGVYIGAHIGGGWSSTSFVDPSAGTPIALVDDDFVPLGIVGNTARGSAFLGGAQVGWMYQVAKLVVGGDLDFSGTRLTGTPSGPATVSFGSGGAFANEAFNIRTRWTATSTATVGLAHDHWLLYSKAGAALANNSYNVSIAGSDFGSAITSSVPGFSETRVGWTVGAGLKWAFTDNWFANIEYDYLDFGSKAQGFTGQLAAFSNNSANATLTPTFNERINQVKVGINYKIPAAALPW